MKWCMEIESLLEKQLQQPMELQALTGWMQPALKAGEAPRVTAGIHLTQCLQDAEEKAGAVRADPALGAAEAQKTWLAKLIRAIAKAKQVENVKNEAPM